MHKYDNPETESPMPPGANNNNKFDQTPTNEDLNILSDEQDLSNNQMVKWTVFASFLPAFLTFCMPILLV